MIKSKTASRKPHSMIIKNLLEEVVKLLPEHHAQTDKILGQRENIYNKNSIWDDISKSYSYAILLFKDIYWISHFIGAYFLTVMWKNGEKKCFNRRSFNGTKVKGIFDSTKYFDIFFVVGENLNMYISVKQHIILMF